MSVRPLPEVLYQSQYREYRPSVVEEELQMTLQIGMVAKDGIIIASDTRAIEVGKAKASFETSKIFFSSDQRMMYSYAGHDIAMLAGRMIAEKIAAGAKEPVSEIAVNAAKEVWNKQYGQYGGATREQQQHHHEVLIGIAVNSLPELWWLDITSNPVCQQVLTKKVTGDPSNTARFFSEVYFPKKSVPVADLLPLAAHVILMGGKINPTGVAGLEIAICQPDGCRKLTETELAPLIANSKTTENLIRKQLTDSV